MYNRCHNVYCFTGAQRVSTKVYYNLYYYCSQHNTPNIYCDVCTECIMLLFTRSCPVHKIADHVLTVVVLSPHASLTVRINLVKRAIFTSRSNRICGRDDQKNMMAYCCYCNNNMTNTEDVIK